MMMNDRIEKKKFGVQTYLPSRIGSEDAQLDEFAVTDLALVDILGPAGKFSTPLNMVARFFNLTGCSKTLDPSTGIKTCFLCHFRSPVLWCSL